MQATAAATILNGFIYKPGWEISARPVGSRLVRIDIRVDMQDSQPKYAPEYTTKLANDLTGALVGCEEWQGREDAEAELLTHLVCLEIHEVREFVRYRDTLKSPAHPHNDAGQGFWDRHRDRILAAAL